MLLCFICAAMSLNTGHINAVSSDVLGHVCRKKNLDPTFSYKINDQLEQAIRFISNKMQHFIDLQISRIRLDIQYDRIKL